MRVIFRLFPLLLLAACDRAEPIPYESIAWANAYYIQNPTSNLNATAGGWLFRGANDHFGELRVGFLIPEPMRGSSSQRHAILKLACPPKSAGIWQLLPPENDLVISVWTGDNKFKDSVTC